MALRTDSVPSAPKEAEEPVGETRLDHEGKGYFHEFKKDKPEAVKEEKPKKKKGKKK